MPSILDHTSLRVLRLAWRRLFLARGYTLVVVLTIALGVAANATVYSLLSGLLSRVPAGVRDPASLVQVGRGQSRTNLDIVSLPLFDAIRRNAVGLGPIAAFATTEALVAQDGAPTPVGVQMVSGEFFPLLGAGMFLGRALDARDEHLAEGAVAVVSHEYWQQALASRGDVVGSTLHINGRAFSIVGVASPRFRGPDAMARTPVAWIPVGAFAIATGDDPGRLASPRMSWLRVVGRLPHATSVERLQSVLNSAVEAIDAELPGSRDEGLVVVRGMRALPREQTAVTRLGGLLQALVALLLVTACANVAVLAYARLSARRGDVAVELALGATRWHLLRTMLGEAALLAGFATLTAAAMTVGASALVRRILPYDLAADYRPDLPILLATGAISLLVAVVASLFPAASVTRTRLQAALAGSASRSSSKGGTRFRQALVAVQFCGCLVLVSVSLACVRSLRASLDASPGFSAAQVLSASVRTNPFASAAERTAQWDRMRERLSLVPGVQRVGAVRALPLVDRQPSMVPFSLEALRSGGGRLPDPITWTAVAGDYFGSMNLRVMTGRPFEPGDDLLNAAPVAIVSQRLATRLFPGRDPVGQRLPFGEEGDPPTLVVGVVADAKTTSLIDEPAGMLYYPLSQRSAADFTVVVRTSTESAAMASAVIKELHAMTTAPDAGPESSAAGSKGDQLLVVRHGWLRALIADSLRDTQLLGTLTLLFGALALTLAAVGVFGSLAFSVEQRRREFAIRLALGASPTGIARLVLRDAMRVAVAGALVGLPVVFASQRMVRGFLYEASPLDPLVVFATVVLMSLTALLAAWLPARRASHTAPARALGAA